MPLTHNIQKASAQIKSALILSALNIHGKTKIIENTPTRDHTERLLKYLNFNFKIKKLKNKKTKIELNGPYEIKSKNIEVAGDPSMHLFYSRALIVPKSKIVLNNVLLNPSSAFLKILKKMGSDIKIKKTKNSGEDVSISARYSKLKGITISSSQSALQLTSIQFIYCCFSSNWKNSNEGSR